MEANYTKLASYLNNNFHPSYVIQTDYPDFALGSSGQPVAWGYDLTGLPVGLSTSLGLFISQQESEFITSLISETNGVIQTYATTDHWQLVDVESAFSTHGYAASVPWFDSMTTALAIQGRQASITSPFGLLSSGAVHPNAAGQTEIASLLEPVMQADVEALLASPGLGLG